MALPDGTTITWYGHSCVRIDTAGRQDRDHRPVVREPEEPDRGRRRRALRRAAGDPRALRPHGRRRRARQPAPAGLAVHARDEPVAGAPAARRRGRRRRVQQGRHGRGRRTQGHDGHAHHSAGDWNAGGETTLYLGDPAGFVIELEDGYRIYHAGDTEPFSDMRLIRELHRPDLAMLPIGGHYTMGPAAPRWPSSSSASRRSCRSTTGRSRSSPGHRPGCETRSRHAASARSASTSRNRAGRSRPAATGRAVGATPRRTRRSRRPDRGRARGWRSGPRHSP